MDERNGGKMNPEKYTSPELSRKLKDAGMVVCVWIETLMLRRIF
jgi:hypothetical protein